MTPSPSAPRRPKGPAGLPLLGIGLEYAKDPIACLGRLRRDHGPGLVPMPLAGMTMYLIGEPHLVDQVLVTDSRFYSKDAFARLMGQDFLGTGLLTAEGDFWRRQRRLSQPAFHKERLQGYADHMVAATVECLSTLTPGPRVDVHAVMMRLTLDIVTRTLFSASAAETADSEHLAHDLEEIMARYANGWMFTIPSLRRLPLPSNRRFAAAVRRLEHVVNGLITRRRQSGEKKADLLDMLLSARDDDGSGMSDRQLRDEIMTIYLAGHETTALLLTYTLLFLGEHPALAERLRTEVTQVLGNRLPTLADLPHLPLLEHIILESLRLRPPAWLTGRQSNTQVLLDDYPLPQGAQIVICPYLLHRDARFFADPLRFHPDRWADGLQKRLPRSLYIPFGGGPRLCIGREFALMEAALVLAVLVSRTRIVLEDPTYLHFLPSITLRPTHPIWGHILPTPSV